MLAALTGKANLSRFQSLYLEHERSLRTRAFLAEHSTPLRMRARTASSGADRGRVGVLADDPAGVG